MENQYLTEFAKEFMQSMQNSHDMLELRDAAFRQTRNHMHGLIKLKTISNIDINTLV